MSTVQASWLWILMEYAGHCWIHTSEVEGINVGLSCNVEIMTVLHKWDDCSQWAWSQKCVPWQARGYNMENWVRVKMAPWGMHGWQIHSFQWILVVLITVNHYELISRPCLGWVQLGHNYSRTEGWIKAQKSTLSHVEWFRAWIFPYLQNIWEYAPGMHIRKWCKNIEIFAKKSRKFYHCNLLFQVELSLSWLCNLMIAMHVYRYIYIYISMNTT